MPTTVTVALVAANAAEQQRWNDSRWAELWPKRERLTNAVTPVLLEALTLRPGDRVLDIGSGAGAAALRAAEIVGSDGTVIGADISAPLVELAERRARGAGVGNASFQVADMQTVRVNGGPFTVAMSQFGVMFFDEPTVAFANIRAHLVAGGGSASPAGRPRREIPGSSPPRWLASSRRRPRRAPARARQVRLRWLTPTGSEIFSKRPVSLTSRCLPIKRLSKHPRTP